MKRKIIASVCLAGALMLTACGHGTINLMAGIPVRTVQTQSPDERFRAAQTDFAIGLLRGETGQNPGKNIVLAPCSLAQTLAMAANGAKGSTRTELEQVLGGRISELNGFFAGIRLPRVKEGKQRLLSANSVWIREMNGLRTVPEFLQTNADCYGADIFSGDFGSSTVSDMNSWIRKQTGGAFGDAAETLGDNTVLCLLNALSFASEWETEYEKKDIRSGSFSPASGGTQQAEYMYSDEDVFLRSEDAVGFTKPYKEIGGHQYEFLAVLPNSDRSLDEYLQTLTAETFPQPAKDACSRAVLPKFGFETDAVLDGTLKDMGVVSAYSEHADFTGMAATDSGNIYLGRVQQKVRIDVDDKGTRAEGITIQLHENSAADPVPQGQQQVVLDRPFLFMIRDSENGIPLFIGVVETIT